MNKIQTFDLNLGAIALSGTSTSSIIDLGSCDNKHKFSIQVISTAGYANAKDIAATWTEESEGLWSRAWAAATHGEATSVYFNTTHLGVLDVAPSVAAGPDALYDWSWGADKLYVFGAVCASHPDATKNPANYFSAITVYSSPTVKVEYLLSNDGLTYVKAAALSEIITGHAVGVSIPTEFTPPLSRWMKLIATEEGVGTVASCRIILAVQ